MNGGGFGRAAYRAAWAMRRAVYPFLSSPTRQRIREGMARRAYEAAVRTRRSPSHPMADGLNVIGNLRAESGVGEAARSTWRAARAAGIPVAAINFAGASPSRQHARVEGLSDAARFGVSVFHVNADELPSAFLSLPRDCFDGRFAVGVWNWELPVFPSRWRSSFDALDEIWAPSVFCREAFAAQTTKPVHVFPFCVTVAEAAETAALRRSAFNLPEQRFVFLSLMDALSVVERKNPEGVLHAYRRAFGARPEKTCLVLKWVNVDGNAEVRRMLEEFRRGDDSIVLLDGYMDRARLGALMGLADAYVSLHRSEGFGLPLAEAMALGKPVIATGWSGNMDFMSAENSLPVPFKLVELERDCGPYEKGATWAAPDVEAAAVLMRRVAASPEFAARIGSNARLFVESNLSPAAVGAKLRARLKSKEFADS